MSYRPYPTNGLAQTPLQRPQAPPSIRAAVKLMYAGGILTGSSLIIGLATAGRLRLAKEPPLTSSLRHSAEVAGTALQHALDVEFIAMTAILALLSVGLWLWMAWENGRGRGWARIVAAILFGLSTLGELYALIPPAAVDTTGIFYILAWLVGLGATICLWRPDATRYYGQVRQRKLAR